MRTVAVVQARLGSSRLPMKSLLCLRGTPIIDWVTRRVSQSVLADQTVAAIPDAALDAVLAEHLQRQGVPCFRGDEHDVLSRVYHAARAFGADRVVRVCADNPLVCGEAIDELLRFHGAGGVDYAYNHVPKNNLWPDGLGAEVVSLAVLEDLHRKAARPEHREHCFSYIWENAMDYRIGTFDPADPSLRRPELRLDIDTREDYCRLARMDIHPDISAGEIIALAAGAQSKGGTAYDLS